MPIISLESTPEGSDVEIPEDQLVADEPHWTDGLPMELGAVTPLPHEEACERLRARLAGGIAAVRRGEFVETSLEQIIRKSRMRMGLDNG